MSAPYDPFDVHSVKASSLRRLWNPATGRYDGPVVRLPCDHDATTIDHDLSAGERLLRCLTCGVVLERAAAR